MEILSLQLSKDLVRDIKRGHPWVYHSALKNPLPKSSGFAVLKDKKGQFLALGVFDAHSPLAFRVITTKKVRLSLDFLMQQLTNVISWKTQLFDDSTTGYRLLFGEGDGFPGLVCDIYGKYGVLQTDGQSLDKVWPILDIADFLKDRLQLEGVVFKPQAGKGEASVVSGKEPSEKVLFVENNLKMTSDILKGQKTGFFLDQRNSRRLIRKVSAEKAVLNLFSYTGGFSVAAGVGGASSVTSVDLSKYAIESCQRHWDLNDLPKEKHYGVAQDVFEFLQDNTQKYDLVIVDPPSFASSKSSVDRAAHSYVQVFSQASLKVLPEGLLALSSCSSHIDFEIFYQIAIDALSKARRKGRVLSYLGQPEDHPFPLACPEMRYLKFMLLQLD